MASFRQVVAQLWAAPVFSDTTKTRRAWLLNFLLNLYIALTLLIFLAFNVFGLGSDTIGWVALRVGVPALGLHWLLRRGQVTLSATLFIAMLVSVMPLAVYMLNSSTSTAAVTAFQLLTLVMAGLLVGWPGLVALLLLIVVINGSFVYTEINQLYLANATPAPEITLFTQIIVYAAVAILLALANSQLGQALARLNHETTQRQHAEQELRKLNALLEQRAQEHATELATVKEAAETTTHPPILTPISHELRTLTNVILDHQKILLTDLASTPQTAANVVQHAEKIGEAAHQLLALSNDRPD